MITKQAFRALFDIRAFDVCSAYWEVITIAGDLRAYYSPNVDNVVILPRDSNYKENTQYLALWLVDDITEEIANNARPGFLVDILDYSDKGQKIAFYEL